MPALLKSRIFYALVALTALAVYLFGFRWTPENQVRIKQKQLFSAIESNDSDKLEKLIADHYEDDWDFDKTRVILAIRDVRSQFLFLKATPADLQVALQCPEARVTAVVRLNGSGYGFTGEVIRRFNRIESPFSFRWEKVAGWPWSWQLTKVANPDLDVPEGYSPGNLFDLESSF